MLDNVGGAPAGRVSDVSSRGPPDTRLLLHLDELHCEEPSGHTVMVADALAPVGARLIVHSGQVILEVCLHIILRQALAKFVQHAASTLTFLHHIATSSHPL